MTMLDSQREPYKPVSNQEFGRYFRFSHFNSNKACMYTDVKWTYSRLCIEGHLNIRLQSLSIN